MKWLRRMLPSAAVIGLLLLAIGIVWWPWLLIAASWFAPLVLVIAAILLIAAMWQHTLSREQLQNSPDIDRARRRERRSNLLAFGAALGLASAVVFGAYVIEKCCTTKAPAAAAHAEILAWWVQLAPGTEACHLSLIFPDGTSPSRGPRAGCDTDLSVRTVVKADQGCPLLHMKAPRHTRAMTKRSKPTIDSFRDVDVCEVTVRSTELSSVERLAGQHDPFPKSWRAGRERTQFVVVGDTGCRNNHEQHCATQWPFGRVADQAVKATVDDELRTVVIHVGDFLYVTADDWNAWQTYFFNPASALLQASPWLMVRGNHERCGAGEYAGNLTDLEVSCQGVARPEAVKPSVPPKGEIRLQ